MTPQERQQVNELFERLARLESAPRDAEAAQAIAEGLARAPQAIYPLVQTVLVQDEALKRADARIRELSGEDEGQREGGGFLDSMRNAPTGRPAQTSVPTVRAASTGERDPRWNSGGALASGAQAPAQSSSGGGSFLGTAAASAAGVIGGALLLNSISSMFGNRGGASAADAPAAAASPWSDSAAQGDRAGSGDLARDAGLNDIGRGSGGGERGAGLFDSGDADAADVSDVGADFGGDGGGDSA